MQKPCDADVKQHIANMMTVITTSTFALCCRKMKDFKMPVAVITFLAAQAGGMVWFLSGMEGRVKTLEGKRLGDVEMISKENRRYIREVIQPSYNISDAWEQTHTLMLG